MYIQYKQHENLTFWFVNKLTYLANGQLEVMFNVKKGILRKDKATLQNQVTF